MVMEFRSRDISGLSIRPSCILSDSSLNCFFISLMSTSKSCYNYLYIHYSKAIFKDFLQIKCFHLEQQNHRHIGSKLIPTDRYRTQMTPDVSKKSCRCNRVILASTWIFLKINHKAFTYEKLKFITVIFSRTNTQLMSAKL